MRSNRYTVNIPKMRTVGGEGDTTPPVESYDLGPKIRAAIACGFFTFVGLGVLWSIAFQFLPWTLETWAKGMVGIAGLGVLVACILGWWWSFVAAYRAWRVDDKARGRRYRQEDDALKAQREAMKAAREQITRGDDVDGNPLTLTDEQRLDFVALRMLELVYMYGRPDEATRDAMTDAGVCTQYEWNLANKGMKALGLRKKQTWQSCTFQEAWGSWRDNIRIAADDDGDRYLEVLKQNGRWHALERIE